MPKKLLKNMGYFFGKKNAQGFPVRYDEWGKEVNVPALTNYDWTGVITPITRNQVKTWVAALRSGSYQQTTGSLCHVTSTGQSYCCLGVVADLFDVFNEVVLSDENGVTIVEDNHESIVEKHDITSLTFGPGKSGSLLTEYKYVSDESTSYYMPLVLQSELAEMNDGDSGDYPEGATFVQIAYHLEEIVGLV